MSRTAASDHLYPIKAFRRHSILLFYARSMGRSFGRKVLYVVDQVVKQSEMIYHDQPLIYEGGKYQMFLLSAAGVYQCCIP